ncbi:hypothetical protein EYF80_009688 [Liparis tanakae]|uniref:Uncharacterized protein n=1 Tax=Liparis tanakae TaxID=230148 RepID=A0A4Z2IQH1_9TELE|nr:hypothetical protein EYF80_009688 [Liparis tanakae]
MNAEQKPTTAENKDVNKEQIQETALLRAEQGRSLYPASGEHKAAHTGPPGHVTTSRYIVTSSPSRLKRLEQRHQIPLRCYESTCVQQASDRCRSTEIESN